MKSIKDLLAACLLTVKMHWHTMKCCVGAHIISWHAALYIQNTQNSKTPNISSYHPDSNMKHIEHFMCLNLELRTQVCCSKYASSDVDCALLDGLDLEMEPNEGEHQALQVLRGKLLKKSNIG